MNKVLSFCAATFLAAAGAANATVYSFDRAVGTGTAFGYFETNGTIGVLTAADIVDFSITIQDATINAGTATTASQVGGQTLDFSLVGSSLTATATDINFDFASDDIFYSYTSTGDFWCVAGDDTGCYDRFSEVIGRVAGRGTGAGSCSTDAIDCTPR